MRFGLKALLLLVTLAGLLAFWFSPLPPLTLSALPSAPVHHEPRILSTGHRGVEIVKIQSENDNSIANSEPTEFTHAIIRNTDDGQIKRELVMGVEECNRGIPTFYTASTVLLDNIPDIDELAGLTEIAEFEKIFGKDDGFKDGWGTDGNWHSSESWRGCEIIGDSIRVVTVFADTSNSGDGWKIHRRTISEGLFEPTGKRPALR